VEVENILGHIDLYRQILRKRRWWIGGVCLLFVGLLGYNAIVEPAYFRSHAVFHPEAETGGSFNFDNPVSMLLGSPGGTIEATNMIGILNSRRISEMVVADTVVLVRDTFFVVEPGINYGILNGDTIALDTSRILLADKVIDIFEPKGINILQWIKRLVLPKRKEPTKSQRIYLAGMHLQNRLQAVINADGFIDMELSVPSPVLIKVLSDKYILALRDYYQNQKTAKAERNLKFFTHRADSIEQELASVNRQVARFFDQSRYRVMAREEVIPRELEARQEYLKEMYVNLVLSREQAVSQLLEVTPIIQVLDYPMPPYKKESRSIVLAILLGLFAGFLLTSLWFCRKQIRQDLWMLVVRSIQGPEEDAAE
jgi:uncharacterized protein involved in exopolysaccharide biosynthesis